MADSRLQILLTAKNNASPAIKQVAGDLRGLDSAAGGVAKGIGGIAAAAGVAGILALGAAAVGTAAELARTGAMVDQIRTAYNDMAASAGASGDAMLAAMRTASRGSISDMDLMQTANRAMLLGVADSAEEFSQLMQIAEARGKALGVSTTQAFDDIVTGIGRQSALILDNLGIVVDADAAYATYAASIGKVASELTDAERKQAFVNAAIASSTDIVKANNAAGENMVDQFERMDAAIQNAKGALGELFAPAMAEMARQIANAAQAAADGMTQMVENREAAAIARPMELAAEKAEGLEKNIAALTAALSQMREAGQQNTEQYRNLAAGLQDMQLQAAAARVQADGLKGAALGAGDGVTMMANAAYAANAALAAAGDTAAAAGDKFVNMGADALAAKEAFDLIVQGQRQAESAITRNASKLVGNMGGGGALKWIDDQNAALAEQNELWKAQGYTQREINEVLMPAYLSDLDKSVSELTRVETATRSISTAAQEVNREFESLKGKVAGVLSGALKLDVGVDPSNFLPREDALNENARRLADIMVNGFKGQDWMGAFAADLPDIYKMLTESGDPQGAAATLLRDFQDGLVPDLIDKEKAKDLVRRMITGEQSMAELAQTIAGELAAEMGVPVAQALAAAQGALGVADSGGAAVGEFATGAATAAAGGEGARIVDAVLGGMRAVYDRFREAGADAGARWGAGFLETVGESVPVALIDMLVKLVTPGVQADMAAQGTLTGAQ